MDGGGRAQGQKSLQTQFSRFGLVYIFGSTPFSFLCTSKCATERRSHNIPVSRTVSIFTLNFRLFLTFRLQKKYPPCFAWNAVSNGINGFALSVTAFEKIDNKFRVRIRGNFDFYFSVDLLC